MSISIKDFDDGNFDSKGAYYHLNNHPITIFLKKNRDQAFTLKDLYLTKELRYGDSHIMTLLRRLKIANLVIHKSPYYAWNNKLKSKFGKINELEKGKKK